MQAVWATVVGHFLIAGDVPLVYILYAFFTSLLGWPMISTEYKWTILCLLHLFGVGPSSSGTHLA